MIFITVARIVSKSHLASRHLASRFGVMAALPLVLVSGSWESLGAESAPPPPDSSQLEETNSQGLLQACVQLQEQLRATQLAIEQGRQEAKEAAAQNTDALAKGLQSIQQDFSAQWAEDLKAKQRSNKVMLIVAGTFAGMGFLTMLMMTLFQWQMGKSLARISAVLPTAQGLRAASAAAALALANQPELRLFGASEPSGQFAHALEPRSHPAPGPRHEIIMPIGNHLLDEPGALVRRRRFRTMSMVLIVGLVCAAGLALLLYVVAYRKLGIG